MSRLPESKIKQETHIKITDQADLLGITLGNMFTHLFAFSESSVSSSNINVANWKSLRDQFTLLVLRKAASEVNSVIQAPLSMINAVISMSSLDQLQNAWSLIIEGHVDVEKWKKHLWMDENTSSNKETGRGEYKVDVAWLDQSPSLFGMFSRGVWYVHTGYGKSAGER
jgi:hypothetical protein